MDIRNFGPGTEFENLLIRMGIAIPDCQQCLARKILMNSLGPNGCRQQREPLLVELRAAAAQFRWQVKLTAVAKALRHGIVLNVLDPVASLFDKAIERAEAKQRSNYHSETPPT